MAFFNNIFKREATEQQQPTTARGGKFADRTVNVRGEQSALRVAAWHRGLAVKADTFAQLVLEYQKRNDRAHGGNYEAYMRAEGRDINYLLQVRPNPTMSASQMLRQMVIQRDTQGNAVLWIERNMDGSVKGLWLCASATLNTINMEYHIQVNMPHPVTMVVGQEDVIHWRNTFSNDHGLTGMPTLAHAYSTLTLAATNNAQALDIAAKGGKHKILIKEEKQPEFFAGMLTKEQRDSQKEEMQKALNEGDDVISMSGLMDAQVISQSAAEQNLQAARAFDTVEICRYLGVPLVLVMDYSNNTYKAPEQAMQAFLQHTIAPMAHDIEVEMNAKLLGVAAYPTLRYHFSEDALMRLDPKGRMDIAKLQLETGIRCPNELRALYDLPTIPNGDTHYVSTNLAEVGSAKLSGNSPVPDASAQGEKGGEQ